MFVYLSHKYNQVITDITTLNNAFHKPYLLSLELRTTLDLLYSNTPLEFSKKLHSFEIVRRLAQRSSSGGEAQSITASNSKCIVDSLMPTMGISRCYVFAIDFYVNIPISGVATQWI